MIGGWIEGSALQDDARRMDRGLDDTRDRERAARPTPRGRCLLAVLLLAAICGAAFMHGRHFTADLEWPGFDIEFREAAAAQTLLAEGLGPDPSYRGESLWYNPLPAAIVAAVSRMSGQPVRVVTPRIGIYLNLLTPIGVFLLIAYLFDPWVALAGAAGLVYVVGPRLPDFLTAKYSPWLSPNNFAIGLCSVTLLAIAWSRRRPRSWLAHLGVGTLLGVTFLAHTAPAIVLGVTLVGLAIIAVRQTGAWRRELSALGMTVAAAAAVGLPILIPVVGRYRMRQLNPGPSLAPFGRLDFNETAAFISDLVTVPLIIGAVGLAAYVWRHRQELSAQILALGVSACVGYIGLNYARQIALRFHVRIPSIVPAFHFVLYLHLFIAIGLGIALAATAVWLLGRVRERSTSADDSWARPAVLLLLTMLVVGIYFPTYLGREEFRPRRVEALRLLDVLATDAWAWIEANTSSQDVFLATDEMALYVVNPAGRKVVATHYFFSNPYVDWDTRDRDRAKMYVFLRECDATNFEALARKYGVTYVIWSDQVDTLTRGTLGMRVRPALQARDISAAGLEPAFRGRDVAIFRVPEPGHAAARSGACKES